MKKKLIVVTGFSLLIFASTFIYHRYKTKRIEEIIGTNQFRLEEYLHYPNENVTIESLDINDADKRIKDLLNERDIATTKPILLYTVTGSVRKQQYWLVDKDEGYYVIEAIDENN